MLLVQVKMINFKFLKKKIANDILKSTILLIYEKLGGDIIIPLEGYWRENENATYITKCKTKEACPLQSFQD